MAKRILIRSIATAVPENRVSQSEVVETSKKVFADKFDRFAKFEEAYFNTLIEHRHLCRPLKWFETPHGWQEKNDIYINESLKLLEEVAINCVQNAQLQFDDIDDILLVSTTGIATPSLEALLMEKLKLPSCIRRTPIFGLGCAGGLLGLSRAAQMAQSDSSKNVLLLVVELCSLNFQGSEFEKKNIIASALFSDGAAGAVISTQGDGPTIKAYSEHRFTDSLGVMGWDVTDKGLGVVFSKSIPHLVQTEMPPLVKSFLKKHDLCLNDINHFVSHPGGAKVISALEDVYELKPESMKATRNTLKNYGNMSAPTVLFALDEALRSDGIRGKTLLSTLGPGFTCGLMLLEN